MKKKAVNAYWIFLIVTFLIWMVILLNGCATKTGPHGNTLFLKEDNSVLYNLDGVACIESGYQTLPYNDTYKLITVYSNCDVHHVRIMKEFEPKMWLPEPKKVIVK